MNLDDIITALAFLNRRQLLKFMQANRNTFDIVMKYFGKKPSIYAQISLQKDYVDHNSSDVHQEFLVHLTALNCDCEQQLSTNNLCTYKSVEVPSNCKCPNDHFSSSPPSSPSSNNVEKFELNYHKNCIGWTKVDDPQTQITWVRSECFVLDRLLDEYRTHKRANNCDSISIWKHPMHLDDTLEIKYICDEYKFAHRQKTYQDWRSCPGLELRSNNFSVIIDHLEVDYVEIYKLDFGPYWSSTQWKTVESEYTKQEFEEYYKMLCWIVENQKITTNTVVEIDLNFLFILFSRLQIEVEKQQFLLNSIAKCGQIQIHNFVNDLWGDKRDEFFTVYPETRLFSLSSFCLMNEFLKHPLLVLIYVKLMPEDILQLLKCYTDSIAFIEKSYRLFVYLPLDNNICSFLIGEFIKSQSPYSYFALVPGIFQKGKHSTIYYNQITKECLRIVPAIRHSTRETEHLPYYMVRYQIENVEVDSKYKPFFDRQVLNVIQSDADWISYNDGSKVTSMFDEHSPPPTIYSFSTFYANVFPDDFGLNGELFNGHCSTTIRRSIVPP